MKNQNNVVTSLLAVVGLGVTFSGVCLATSESHDQSNPPATSPPATSAQSSTTESAARKEIDWHTSLDSAMTESAISGKLIFVYFYATWCPPCKLMDEQTFSNADFIDESQNWVMLKIDIDKDAETVTKYGVQGPSTLGVLRADGKPVMGTEGYHSARELMTFMQAAKNQAEAEQVVVE